MTLMHTIDRSLRVLCMFAMILRSMLVLLSNILAYIPLIGMLVSMMLFHVLNLCAYMLCHSSLSNHMRCLRTTLVGLITSRMLGFALTLTTFVFPSVCCTCSF